MPKRITTSGAGQDVDVTARIETAFEGTPGGQVEDYLNPEFTNSPSWFDQRLQSMDDYSAPQFGNTRGFDFLNEAKKLAQYRWQDMRDARVEDYLAPQFSPPGYSALEEQTRLKSSIETQFRSELADEGKLYEFGSRRSQLELNSRLADASLAERITPWSSFREEMGGVGGAFGVGYAAMSFGSGVSQYITQTQAGQFVAPEIQQASVESSVAQGVGTLGGTFIGAGIGALTGNPMAGSLAGQFVGQAGGQIYGASVTAEAERNVAGRETSQLIGTELGATVTQIREFAQALQEAGAPLKEMQAAFTTSSHVGIVSDPAAAIRDTAAMSNALGERYNPALSAGADYLRSNPALLRLGNEFASSGGRMSPGSLGDLAVSSAFSGDLGTADRFMELQEGSVNAQDPRHARDMATVRQYQQESSTDAGAIEHGFQRYWNDFVTVSTLGMWRPQNSTDAAMDAARRLNADKSAADAASAKTAADVSAGYNAYADTAGAQSVMDSSLSIAGSTGASASTLQGIVDASAGSVDAYGASLRSYISAHPNMDRATRDQYENELRKMSSGVAGARRSVFLAGVGEQESEYSLGVTERSISGISAADEAFYTRRQQNYLQGLVDNPSNPLSPTERNAISEARAKLGFQNAQQQYGQEEASLAITGAGVDLGVSTARAYGGPSDVRSAEQGQIQQNLALIQQMNSELERGNLTYDQRLDKQKQIVELSQANVEIESASRNEFFESQSGIISSNRAELTAGLSRAITRGGNAAFDPSIIATDQRSMANDQARLAAARSDQEIASARAMVAEDRERIQGDYDVYNTYRQNAQESIGEITARGRLSRSLESPWMDGPDSDPFNKFLSVEQIDQRKINELNANRQRAISSRTWRPEDEEQYQSQYNEYAGDLAHMEREQFTGMLSLLPEMVQGSVGGGIQSAVVSGRAAMSAVYSPNPFVSGTPGRAANPGDLGHMSSSPAVGFGDRVAVATERGNGLLQQAVDLLAQIVHGSVHGVAATNDLAPIKRALSMTLSNP